MNYLQDLGVAILKNYYTQTIVLYASDLLAVYELAVSAKTCTQPLSELATVSVGCVEVPEPTSGRRRRVWGSWHLQTAHIPDHCDLRRCTGYITTLSKHPHSMP